MRRVVRFALCLAPLLLVASPHTLATNWSDEMTRPGYFVVDVVGERFVVHIKDPEAARQARRILAGNDPPKIINGALKRGHGGYNFYGETCYPWRMDPNDIQFADMTIELCDGMPSYVSAELDYWIKEVGRYCPWAGRLVEEIEKPEHPKCGGKKRS